MAFTLDALVGPVMKILGKVADPIGRQVGYVIFWRSYVGDLKREVTNLEDARTKIDHDVHNAKNSGAFIEDGVVRWLHEAEELKAVGKTIPESHTACYCYGWIPNPVAWHQLGRKAKKAVLEIKEHREKKKDFENAISYQVAGSATVSSTTSSNFFALKSRTCIVEKIMNNLEDVTVSMVGVYGMGGIGKSTLLKEVERRATESNRFDAVEFFLVSQTPDINRIRGDITLIKQKIQIAKEENEKKVDKDDSKKEDDKKKDDLGKQILIVLDDIWKKLDLKDIGIMETDKNVKFKLVLTSRNEQVLVEEMNCHRNFHLDVLDEEEAMDFLANLVGEKIIKDPELKPVAAQLAKSCAGVPISIETLAKTMNRSSSPKAWEDALHQLKGINTLYPTLDLSYQQLGNEHLKSLFVLCGLFRKRSIEVKHLLRYSLGLGLFGNINSMETARERMRAWLRSLRACSFLLSSDDKVYVEIHDVVREFATRISYKEKKVLVLNCAEDLKECSIEKLNRCRAMSSTFALLLELPKGWRYKELEILSSYAETPTDVPDLIYAMRKLKVLDLENARLTRLPPLKNLVTLCLHTCYVKDMSGIENLESLQVLSFIGSEIEKLPKEVGELTNMRVLDLSRCSNLKTIEPGALERLTRLEELHMVESFDAWGAEGAAEQSNASLAELNSMPHLSTLDILIANPSVLPEDLPFGKLDRYRIYIGDVWDWHDENKELRILKLKLACSRVLFKMWFQTTLQRTQNLHLDGLSDTTRSIHELCVGGFEELKHLHIQNSPSVHYIIHSTEWFPRSGAFTILESLSLHNLINLEKISHGLIAADSFTRLKVVKVSECDNIRSLFSLSSIKGLEQLEEIEISKCQMIQEIVVAERMADEGEADKKMAPGSGLCCSRLNVKVNRSNMMRGAFIAAGKTANHGVKAGMAVEKVKFNNLRHLTLRSLPNFSAFFATKANPRKSMENPSEKQRSKSNDDASKDVFHNLTAFFGDHRVSLPKLESLAVFQLEKLKHLWPKTEHPVELGNLRSLRVDGCDKLLNVFSSSVLTKLRSLEFVSVSRCSLIKEVFDLEELGAESEIHHQIVPQLKDLQLNGLENLKYIWSKSPGGHLGPRYLTKLRISDCGDLEYIFTSSIAKAMEKLTELNVRRCDKMVAIVKDVTNTIVFPHLKELTIRDCPNMKGFSIHSTSNICSCSKSRTAGLMYPTFSMTRLCLCLGKKQETEETTTFFNQKILFPSLEDLVLDAAGNFETIWHDHELPEKSFNRLTSITLWDCGKLLTAFPAAILDRLQHLQEVEIYDCASMEIIFELRSLSTTKCHKSLLLPQLKEVELSELPELKHFVEKDSQVQLGLPSLTKIDLSSCNQLRDLVSTATATTLSKLEMLNISNCSTIKEIVVAQDDCDEKMMDDIIFPLLTSLELTDLKSLICFSSRRCQFDFPSLKTLSVENCPKMKIFAPMSARERLRFEAVDSPQPLFNEKVGLPNLEQLTIRKMEMKELWLNEPFAGSFRKLKDLEVADCPQLQNIIPFSMLKGLKNLESLEVKTCKRVEHIVAKANDKLVLPQLNYLVLHQLPKLCSFCWGKYAIELPSLRELSLDSCKGLGVVAADLRYYEENQTLPLFWLEESLIPSLKVLNVLSCDRLVTVFRLQRVINLETLSLSFCESLEVLYDFNGFQGDKKDSDVAVTTTCKLKKLQLYTLQNLRLIWTCDQKVNLSYENLSVVKIAGCVNIRYLFPASVARTLSHLEELEITESGLEEIVGEEEDEVDSFPKFVFPRVLKFVFTGLPKLRSFYPKKYDVEWPMLKKLKISGCGSVEIFASDHQTSVKPLFLVDKDSFPLLEKLEIHSADNLIRIFDGQIAANSFNKLTEIEAEKCNNLVALCPPCILHTFVSLEKLKISECDSLGVIYDVQQGLIVDNPGDQVAATKSQLKELHLDKLGKLEHIWNGDPEEILDFQDLSSLDVAECGNLKSLFPAYVAKSLLHLDVLKASRCGLEEIIARDDQQEEVAGTPNFLFPLVTSLNLCRLPKLRSLYSAPHTSYWPSLKGLTIFGDNIIQIFSKNNLQTFQSEDTEKVAFPCLEVLNVETDSEVENCTGEFHPQLFPELRVLSINGSHPVALPNLIHKTQKFKKLVISGASCEVLFQNEGPHVEEDLSGGMANLSELELNNLPELTHVWKADSGHALFLENLETFKVLECAKLINLLPSSMSFLNLTSLEVSKCHGLKALMTSATAKSLAKLTRMSIGDCGDLIEIVADNSNDGADEIAFSQLSFLELRSLERITHFCSGNYQLKFPLLEEVVVKECLWMRCFSKGAVITPKLEELRTSKGSCWVDNLNKTFKWLFAEQLSNLERLNLASSTVWQEKWLDPLPSGSFTRLKSLIVDLCAFSTAIPFDKVIMFSNLERLEVRNCDELQEVFDSGTPKARVKFPMLEAIVLENLPKLQRFCPGSCFLDFPSLKGISIKQCPSMKTFTSQVPKKKRMLGIDGKESSRGDVDIPPKPFFCEKVLFPSLEKLTFKHMDSLSLIWPNRFAKESFSQLKKFKVEHCGKLQQILPASVARLHQSLTALLVRSCNGLTSLVTSSAAKSLKHLNVVVVNDCKKMERIVADDGNGAEDEICLRQLRTLGLLHLPVLVCFSSSNCITLKLPFLSFLTVKGCPRMTTFSNSGLVTPRLHRVLQIDEDEDEDEDEGERGGRWDGDLNTTIGNMQLEMAHRNANDEDESENEGEMEGRWDGDDLNTTTRNMQLAVAHRNANDEVEDENKDGEEVEDGGHPEGDLKTTTTTTTMHDLSTEIVHHDDDDDDDIKDEERREGDVYTDIRHLSVGRGDGAS